jgi:hypothetical protein
MQMCAAVSTRDVAGFVKGSLFLFGGSTEVSTSSSIAGDLWVRPFSSQAGGAGWIYLGGTSTLDQAGDYRVQGQSYNAKLTTALGARSQTSCWWSGDTFYVGFGFRGQGDPDIYNDLYVARREGCYCSADASIEQWLIDMLAPCVSCIFLISWSYSHGDSWIWLSGAQNGADALASANYGIKGSPSADTMPAPRLQAAAVADSNSRLFIHGGLSYSNGNQVVMNDLFYYDIALNQWVSGRWRSAQKGGSN